MHYKKILIAALALFLMLGTASFAWAAADPLDRTYPAVLLVSRAIEDAGIPIDGVSGWPIERIMFRPEATDEQQQQAWDIVHTFNLDKAVAKAKAADSLVTAYGGEIPKLTQDGQIAVADVNGHSYIYFQSNGETHHILGNASFEIDPAETTDKLSGEKMQVGDFVIGMIDSNLGNGDTPETSSLHGVWVKWSSVKAQLIDELKGDGLASTSVSGVDNSSLLSKLTDSLVSLGISIKDGVTHIANLAVDTFYAKTARIEKLEAVDQATGEIYCTWVENGQWQKVKGACAGSETPAPVAPPADSTPAAPAPQDTPVSSQPDASVTPDISSNPPAPSTDTAPPADTSAAPSDASQPSQ